MPRRRPEKITVVRTVFTDLDKAYPSEADKAEGRVPLAYYISLSVVAVRDCLKAYEYFEETVGYQLPDTPEDVAYREYVASWGDTPIARCPGGTHTRQLRFDCFPGPLCGMCKLHRDDPDKFYDMPCFRSSSSSSSSGGTTERLLEQGDRMRDRHRWEPFERDPELTDLPDPAATGFWIFDLSSKR